MHFSDTGDMDKSLVEVKLSQLQWIQIHKPPMALLNGTNSSGQPAAAPLEHRNQQIGFLSLESINPAESLLAENQLFL